MAELTAGPNEHLRGLLRVLGLAGVENAEAGGISDRSRMASVNDVHDLALGMLDVTVG